MKLNKNTIVKVNHKRFGEFTGIVLRSFDTDIEEFYPIALYQESKIFGLARWFEKGDVVPCRKEFVTLKIIVKNNKKYKD